MHCKAAQRPIFKDGHPPPKKGSDLLFDIAMYSLRDSVASNVRDNALFVAGLGVQKVEIAHSTCN